MRIWAPGLLLCATASAHVISMSNGYATVMGNRVEYILRMPMYEMTEHSPEELFRYIRFTSGFETARMLASECHPDPSTQTYLCAASYQFEKPVERLGVECTFYEITVSNHIHMLHAERGGKSDQAILDSSFPSASLAFRPPTAAEIAAGQSFEGAMRVWKGPVQLLLLIALALAARRYGELAVNAIAFLAGECAAAIAILRSSWQPSPRFAEAAAALALAYLAFEILTFPKSRGRWLLALVFGAFAGMYFANFIEQSGFRSVYVLTGASIGGLLVLLAGGVVGYLAVRLDAVRRHDAVMTRIAASMLLIAGGIWFAIRLRS